MVLSPLLANIYLHYFDITLNEKSKGYIRYCDDFVVLCKDEKEANEFLKFIDYYIENELLLSLNKEKTRICNIKDGFTFLGFHFSEKGKKPSIKSIERLKSKIENELKSADKISEEQLKTKLRAIIRGWQNYFGLLELSEEDLIKEVEKLSKFHDNSFALNIFKTALYIQSSQTRKAYEVITENPSISSEEGELHYQWGILCESLGLHGQAIDEYYQSLKLNSSHTGSLYQLGKYFIKQGKIEKAIKFLQRAITLSPDNFELYIAIADAYNKWQLYGSAAKALSQAKQLNPNIKLSPEIHQKLPVRESICLKVTKEDVNLFLKLFFRKRRGFCKTMD